MNEVRLVHSSIVDPVAKEFLKVGSECISYISATSSVIKKEYVLGNLEMRTYERLINLLTIIKLQLEFLETISKDSVNKTLGVFVDAKV